MCQFTVCHVFRQLNMSEKVREMNTCLLLIYLLTLLSLLFYCVFHYSFICFTRSAFAPISPIDSGIEMWSPLVFLRRAVKPMPVCNVQFNCISGFFLLIIIELFRTERRVQHATKQKCVQDQQININLI